MARHESPAPLSRRTFLRRAFLVTASGLLAACAPPAPPAAKTESKPAATAAQTQAPPAAKPADAKPAAGGKTEIVIAHIGLSAGEQSMDPNFESTESSVHINMFDTLIRPFRTADANPRFEFRPGLAESWKLQPDGLTWELKLRRGARFHDGTEVTGEDVRFTLQQVNNPDFKSRMAANGTYEGLKEVQVVDPHTIRITTTQPLPMFESRLTRLYIYPKAYYESVGAEQFGLKPIGSGPYTFVSWTKGDQVVLEAHDGYWGGAPAVKRATFKAVPEASTRVAMLQAGQADLINDVPPQLYENLKREGRVDVFQLRSMNHVVMGLDGRDGPMADVRVRQAINYAVNKDEMIERLFRGFARRAVTTVADGLPGFTPEINAMYPHNLDRAKALLAEAGYANGFEVGLLYSEGRLFLGKVWTQAIVGYLEKIGIKATIETAEAAQRLQRIREGKVPAIFLTSLLNQDIDAEGPFRIWLSKKGRGFYWPQLDVDAQLEQQRTELDSERRRVILEDINRKAVEHACYIYSHFENSGWGATKGFSVQPRHDGYILLHEARFS